MTDERMRYLFEDLCKWIAETQAATHGEETVEEVFIDGFEFTEEEYEDIIGM